MPKKANELSPLAVSRLNAPGHHFVGGVAGLALQVLPSGARTWVLRVMVAGKRREMGLGGYPDVTLAIAREKARQAREKIYAGVDPIVERRKAQSALVAARASQKTFGDCVTGFLDAKSGEWRNAKHRAQWSATLDKYAASLKGMLVADIELPQVLAVLQPIWAGKTETASRVRGRIESVLDWATVRGYRAGENPARWRGHLEQLLARPSRIAKAQHHPALPIDDVPAFMAKLRAAEGQGARALELAILTAARSGEVRGAVWSEFDLEAGVWTVPAERIKAGREHRVPLSKAALKLLGSQPRGRPEDLVFLSPRGKALSDMTLSAVMRRMEVDAVPHGFRSTFRDWASERTNYPREVAEMALAHVIESKTEAAYRRGDLFEKRRKMMDDWASFCARTPTSSAKVVPMQQKRA